MERTSSRDCKKLVPEHFRTGTSKKKKSGTSEPCNKNAVISQQCTPCSRISGDTVRINPSYWGTTVLLFFLLVFLKDIVPQLLITSRTSSQRGYWRECFSVCWPIITWKRKSLSRFEFRKSFICSLNL